MGLIRQTRRKRNELNKRAEKMAKKLVGSELNVFQLRERAREDERVSKQQRRLELRGKSRNNFPLIVARFQQLICLQQSKLHQ